MQSPEIQIKHEGQKRLKMKMWKQNHQAAKADWCYINLRLKTGDVTRERQVII